MFRWMGGKTKRYRIRMTNIIERELG